jgi:hypothetical protein
MICSGFSDHFRAGCRGLGREAHRGGPHSFRSPRSLPGRQGLHGDRVGAAVDRGLQRARCGRPEKQLPQGMVEGRSALGLWKTPNHRRADRPTQGLLRLGASPGEDVGRAAEASGRQGRGLHLRTTHQRLPRPTAASSGGPVDLAHCTSVVSELADPLGVLGVGLPAGDVLHMPGVQQPALEVVFEHVSRQASSRHRWPPSPPELDLESSQPVPKLQQPRVLVLNFLISW